MHPGKMLILYFSIIFFLVRIFLILKHDVQCLSNIYAWPTMLAIVTWLVERIAEKLP